MNSDFKSLKLLLGVLLGSHVRPYGTGRCHVMAGEDRAVPQSSLECAAQPSPGERHFLLSCVMGPAVGWQIMRGITKCDLHSVANK